MPPNLTDNERRESIDEMLERCIDGVVPEEWCRRLQQDVAALDPSDTLTMLLGVLLKQQGGVKA
ncbi:hypothetical protein PR003_g19106 [Phytophthora rubi]|uniref:Uncharacterized protein n=1 Tax=Phytophthora rubi TaxID=129364 RepID=A0A6A3JPE2_9STRA|nr:hypothetical protein PR001_g25937 [Phytophthora rubi]KAE8997136.1 hypothetical protein PR002_g19123 [Phytophthora rubi]KAE9314991.1 hypothetical protein PR003_g19106 [Phytophthora rubi]